MWGEKCTSDQRISDLNFPVMYAYFFLVGLQTLPYQVKRQYLQIYNISSASIKHKILCQSTTMVKGCMYIYVWYYSRYCLQLWKIFDRLLSSSGIVQGKWKQCAWNPKWRQAYCVFTWWGRTFQPSFYSLVPYKGAC